MLRKIALIVLCVTTVKVYADNRSGVGFNVRGVEYFDGAHMFINHLKASGAHTSDHYFPHGWFACNESTFNTLPGIAGISNNDSRFLEESLDSDGYPRYLPTGDTAGVGYTCVQTVVFGGNEVNNMVTGKV